MQLEITSVSTSKKGTVWVQAKILDKDMKPEVGDIFITNTLLVKTSEQCPECQGNPAHMSSFTKNGEHHRCGCRSCVDTEVEDT